MAAQVLLTLIRLRLNRSLTHLGRKRYHNQFQLEESRLEGKKRRGFPLAG